MTPPPGLGELNARAAAAGLHNACGVPLRFVPPDADPLPYEERVFLHGEVVTRPDNWHDAYNAAVWCEFPQSKALLNRLHVDALRAARARGDHRRGQLRDRITQFDECGVAVTGLSVDLWDALIAHRWREVFVDHRASVRRARFHLFGHASRDALRAPFPGLCGKLIRIEPADDTPEALDGALAARLAGVDFARRWPVIPLLGIPGITPASEDPAYYDDERQFRPLRAAA